MGFNRKIKRRKIKDRVLIVCEGEKTEPNYFKAFRHTNLSVKVIGGRETSPTKLVKEAIRLKKKAEREYNPYKYIWCVFDIDDNSKVNIDKAIKLANSNNIKFAYSNEAFELWYLLHYDYHNTAIPRKSYITKLTRKLKLKYRKNYEFMYDILLPLQENAIKNAKRLLSLYNKTDPHSDNPSTTVFKLVELLNNYK